MNELWGRKWEWTTEFALWDTINTLFVCFFLQTCRAYFPFY